MSYFPAHENYVEVFGGGGSVLLQKPRSKREIINDIDDELANLYRVMRDRGSEMRRLCELTPHSRSELALAYEMAIDPVEKARRTVVKSFFGIGDSVFNRNGMRASRTSNTCPAKSWVSWCDQLDEIIARFRGVVIESRPYPELLNQFDSETTLFYLDPPYVPDTRSARHAYRHEFGNEDHVDLIERVQKLKGFCILSGYDHEIYQALPWPKVQQRFQTQKKTTKVETLWISPRTLAVGGQLSLDLAPAEPTNKINDPIQSDGSAGALFKETKGE